MSAPLGGKGHAHHKAARTSGDKQSKKFLRAEIDRDFPPGAAADLRSDCLDPGEQRIGDDDAFAPGRRQLAAPQRECYFGPP